MVYEPDPRSYEQSALFEVPDMFKPDRATRQRDAQFDINELQRKGAHWLLMGLTGSGGISVSFFIGEGRLATLITILIAIVLAFCGFWASLNFWKAHDLAHEIAGENDWRWTGWKFVDKNAKPTTNWEDAVP